MTTTTNQSALSVLKSEDLSQLASVSGTPCVSILMRTHRRGRETQQGSIRLKNLLKEAAAKLTEAGYDDSLLESLRSKPDETEFWQHQGDGLAVFLTAELCQLFRLNRPVDDLVVVDESFYLQPLLREAEGSGEYFVLALSWDDATLYRATNDAMNVVETPVLPAKFRDLVLPRDPEESIQHTSHRSVANTPGTSTAMFHGQGEGEGKVEADRDQYLSLVGDEVAGEIYNTGCPLVLVATKEVAGHFQATTHVSVDAKVAGSPSELSDDELQQKSREAIEPLRHADRESLAQRFGTAKAHGAGESDLSAVLEAAASGRIDVLMVCPETAQAGRSDDGTPLSDHFTRVNQAVILTLRSGGNVVQCRRESMPEGTSGVAAIFRY